MKYAKWCLILVILVIFLTAIEATAECPNNKLDCLRQHFNTDPNECESDANIGLNFIDDLGQSYDPSGLMPIDSYFLWTKVLEENEKDPNTEIIPSDTKGLELYTLDNLQYAQILNEIKGLKPWQASEDCGKWVPTETRTQQVTRSATAWFNLAKLLKGEKWKKKLIIFGRGRPSPLSEAYSDKNIPIRFIIQNQISEHNNIALVNWIKEIKETFTQAEEDLQEVETKQLALEASLLEQQNKQVKNEQVATDSKALLHKLQTETKNATDLINETIKTVQNNCENRLNGIEATISELKTNQPEQEIEEIERSESEIEEDDFETSGHNIHEDTKIESGNRTLKKRNISNVSQTKKVAESVKDILTVIKNVNNIWDTIKEQKQTGLRFSVRLEDLEKIRNTTEKLIKLGQDCKSCAIFSNYILITTGIAAVLYTALVILAAVWWCKENKDYPPTDEQSETSQPRYNPSAPTVSSIEDSQELIPLRPLPPPPTETRQFRVQKLKKQTKRL